MRTKKLLFTAVMLLMVPVVGSAGVGPAPAARGLKDIVARAIEHNNELQAAGARANQAEQSVVLAHRQKYPALNLEASFIRSDDPVFAFGSLLRQQRFTAPNFALDTLNRPGPLDNFSAAVTLGVPLYAGGRLTAATAIAQTMSAYAQAGLSAARENLLYQVSVKYLDALYNKSLQSYAVDAESVATQEIESAKKLTARGMLPGAEYYGALAVARSLTGRRIAAENGMRTAVDRLNIYAHANDAPFTVNGLFPETEGAPETIDNLLATAGEQRRDIAMAALHGRAQTAALAVEKNSVLPAISAFGATQGDSNDVMQSPIKYTVGVKMSMPLFDPAYGARVRAARERCAESVSQEASLKDSAAFAVTEAYNNYEASRALLTVAKDAREQAGTSVRMLRSLYREGRISVLDAVRGEEGLFLANAAVAEAAYRMQISHAAILASAGKFNETAVADVCAFVGEELR